jgi:hypothetical protein
MIVKDVILNYVGEATYNFDDGKVVTVDKFLGLEADNNPFSARFADEIADKPKPSKYQTIHADIEVFTYGGKPKLRIVAWK